MVSYKSDHQIAWWMGITILGLILWGSNVGFLSSLGQWIVFFSMAWFVFELVTSD